MEVISKNIAVKKTARYFLSGENKNPQFLMFVLHGYGMPARNFLEEFKALGNKNILIVSPEGLSRFYTKGFYGNIGASWMTSEDRENEIEDYIGYLDEVYKEVLSDWRYDNQCRGLNLCGRNRHRHPTRGVSYYDLQNQEWVQVMR
jgi:hypothetical protein